VTAVGGIRLLMNSQWVDPAVFTGFDLLHVDPTEPASANVLLIGQRVLCAAEHPRTRARLEAAGVSTIAVAAGELAKAEAGLTCCSVLVRRADSERAAAH
jgi:dimethylargininase